MKKKCRQLPYEWCIPIRRMYLFLLIILCSSVLFANSNDVKKEAKNFTDQQATVTGSVTDENDLPLPGVTILEKGTMNGVVSNVDGNYSITLTGDNAVLVFSYIGYRTKEIAATSSTVDLKMEPESKQLDEFIVVGYGTKKKSELTNAVVQTTGEELKKSTAISVSNTLSGKLAGLYVSQRSGIPGFDDAQIKVRGYNTYRDASALIVIDGVANADPDGLNRLDPNDIESISVLKDASAAIYGAQSAGGVILVTTKRGKSGKPSFNFTTNQSFQSPTMEVRSADEFEYMDVLNANRALDGGTPDFPADLYNAFKTGERRAENWYDAVVDPPVYQNRYSITMNGGTDRARYFASAGTAHQNGILRGDDVTSLDQYNLRSNLDVNVTDNFEVGLDITYRQKNTEQPQGGSGSIAYFANTSPLQEAYIGGDYRYPGEGWSHLSPAARVTGPGYNRINSDVINAALRFKYEIPFVKGLTLDGFASYVKAVGYNKTFNYVWKYYEKGPDGIVEKTSRSVEDIGLREDFNQSKRLTLNAKLEYLKTFNDVHKLNAFVAYEQMDYQYNYFWMQRLGYDSPLIDQLFAGSPIRANWNSDGSASESARQNLFGRASYDYDGKYLFGFNFRYDGSPIFPEDTRWGFFPGVSAGWVISKESFMENSGINNLKLRASWGQLGNDRVKPFQYIGAYGYSAGWVVNNNEVRGLAATTEPNPNITWEVTETTDIGLELGVLNNRLTFELDVYKSLTSNILGQRQASIPTYAGLVLPDENIGEMESRGIEVQAGFKQKWGDVNFTFDGNYSYNDNKIIYFDEVPQAEPYQKQEGLPLGTSLLYKAIGIYRTQADLDNNVNYAGAGLGDLIFADLNGDKVINSRDRYRTRTTQFPKMQFGFNFGVEYKNFDLSMLLQGQSGATFRLSNGFNSDAGGNGLEYVANNTYNLDNVDAELPRIRPKGTGGSDNDFWYHESTFVRLKSIQFGYNLPKSIMSSVKIDNLRLFISGENLFMIYNNLSKYGAGDPEFLSGNGGTYPNMKTITLGLNLTF